MRLLQTEIEAVPGREPDRAARKEGFVGVGSAYLEIRNSTDRVNSYTVRVACDHPYWQAAWYQLTAMPPETGDQNQPPKGKPDQPGAKNQSLRIHINKDGARKILLAFKLPANPEARAGAYPIRIVIESVITDASVAGGPPRVTELPATLIVRPFFDWEISFRPEDKSVGALRRKGHVELAVTNKGNDWLYLEFKRGPSQVMNLDAPVVRLAVAPPEPGQTFERSVPLTAITKLRTVRGDKNSNNLPITVTRVDAPTVPPLPEPIRECTAANLGRSVVPTATTETQAPATPGTLTYCPPIPATLAGFFQAVLRNAKAIAMLAVGAFLMFMGVTYLFEKTMHNISNISIAGLHGDDQKNWDGPDDLILEGDMLKPCVIEGTFTPDNDPNAKRNIGFEPQDNEYTKTDDRPWYTAMTWGFKPPHHAIKLNDELHKATDNQSGTVTLLVFRRFWFLGSLGMKGLPPRGAPGGTFHIGPMPVSTAQLNASLASPTVNPGQSVVLVGSGLGSSPNGAIVMVGTNVVTPIWSDTKITIPVPASFKPGDSFNVVIDRGTSKIWGAQTVGITGSTAPGAVTPPSAGQTGTPNGSPAASKGATPTGNSGSNGGGNGGGAPIPSGAATVAKAIQSGPFPKDQIAALPAVTAADHAVRAIAYFSSGDRENGNSEADAANGQNDYKSTMNALMAAVDIAKQIAVHTATADAIEKDAKTISDQLGPTSQLKLPYIVAAQGLDAVGKKDDAAAYRQKGAG